MGRMLAWRGTGGHPAPSVGLSWVTLTWQEGWWQGRSWQGVTAVSTSTQGPCWSLELLQDSPPQPGPTSPSPAGVQTCSKPRLQRPASWPLSLQGTCPARPALCFWLCDHTCHTCHRSAASPTRWETHSGLPVTGVKVAVVPRPGEVAPALLFPHVPCSPASTSEREAEPPGSRAGATGSGPRAHRQESQDRPSRPPLALEETRP